MTLTCYHHGLRLAVAIILTVSVRLASAQESALAPNGQEPVGGNIEPSSFALQPGEDETAAERVEITTFEEEKPACPASFDVTYYLYSDYIFRGINFSEYGTEGREKLNHQMTTDMSFDLGKMFGQPAGQWGTVSFGTFFEWYGAQKVLDPEHGGQNLQEVDYVLSWSYDIEPIATGLTLGYTFYTFPNAKGINTSEWFFSLAHNDAWMWRWLWPNNEDGVLNPSFFFAQDVDIADGGCWMEFGLSHAFGLFDNFTLTPEVVFAVDHRWLDPVLGTGRPGATRLAFVRYGLSGAYDLTPMLHLPDWAGSVSLAAFLYFSDALGNIEDNDLIQDEFYGGMSIGWSWGG